MFYEGEKCPYITECRKFRDGKCHKVERYKECGDYYDFKWEISGSHQDKIKDIVEKLSKLNKIEKVSENKSKKKLEICPNQWKCHYTFKMPCNYSRSHEECCSYECEDCNLNISDLGAYCKTGEYWKCESYKLMSNLREEYESNGVHNTKDLKAHVGEENYELLGGYIRCAFLELEDIE